MDATTSALSPAPQTKLALKITDIECNQLPQIGWPKRPGKFYVRLTIDREIRETLVSPRVIEHIWTETFHFDACDSSILKLEVYARRKIGSDDNIGEMEERVAVLLAQKNVVRTLSKRDSKGAAHDIRCVAKFTIVSINDSIGVTERQMDDTVEQGKKAIEQMASATLPIEPLDGAVVAVNSATAQLRSITDTWGLLLGKVEQFTKIVDGIAEVHPYAKMAWSILSAAHKIVIDQVNLDSSIHRLVEVMDNVFAFVHEATALDLSARSSQKDVLASMAKQTTECAYFIRDYAKNKNFWLRTAKNLVSDVDSKIKEYEGTFDKLRLLFLERAALQTEITVLQTNITVSRILDAVKNLAAGVDLNDMPYAHGARFNADRECLLGTRERIIDDITDWVNSTDAPRICLLTGVAGSGKSSIAMSVARRFDELGRLGSSFCFDRSHAAERRPDNVFSTIARDLADLDVQRKGALWQVVQGKRALRTTRTISEQFNKFILLPAAELMAIGPILIVIDALDESGDKVARKGLISTLGRGISKLPPNFRIFITSRAEADIQDRFDNHPDALCIRMDAIDRRSTNDDIFLFVRSQLSEIKRLDQSLCTEWCHQLVKKAEGLFQWASTACLFIATALDPGKRLDAILSLAPQSDQQGFLDNLYHTILKDLLKLEAETSISYFKQALGMALAVMEPLPLASLTKLSQNIDGPSMEILWPLGSLLSGVTGDLGPVRPLHTSFRDFLTKERGKEFFICASAQDKDLALASLRAMRGLQFNICHLETSHLCNSQICDLAERTSKAIPQHLSYSCRFFAIHLQATTFDSVICKEVEEFMTKQLLYWLEVLSLIKHFDIAAQALSAMCQWVETHNDQLAALAIDAQKFVDAFGSPISQSAPHIYLSALPFAPTESLVSRTFLPKFSNVLSVSAGKAVGWPVIQYVLEGHTGSVNSVAFSSDGKYIVSGSLDNTICVWDAVTGEVISGPLEGHTSNVKSVAFSPDGKNIVSGSDDRTICVWDAMTGDVVYGPLEGHTGQVLSVAFSPDGKHIVSGSTDNTICVWDAVTGQVVSGPLEFHTGWVFSVAFSPDGKHIVSGSVDKTICVWDALTGEVVSGPLASHAGFVLSVAFSPDGKHIVSGSSDNTICLWDVATGQVVSGPLEGHSSYVFSVAFSPDGKHIVSGSNDRKICVWDAVTRKVASSLPESPTDIINSVAFSPDGRHIVSGSSNKATCVWDAVTGEIISGPFQGHTSDITSVAFSPDGKHIVSGSLDKTIWVWDAVTGDIVSGPLEGHTSIVNSVAFSPDGKHIVSGSNDEMVCVWDAVTGQVVSGPLKGHTSIISSVAFSPLGKHIVSGDQDGAIYVWNAVTGEIVSAPEGHGSRVNSVAFSPDGKHIVSGSKDKTICVWDAVTGEFVSGPLEGHTGWVTSVAFSPDGKHIVSGSQDNTICVWDVMTGVVVSGPLCGHTDWVNSVSLSLDGKCIVSGSSDETIRVWDAVTGELFPDPLEGHTGGTQSIAFSPDSQHIVSGSHDMTIQSWIAATEAIGSRLLDGHIRYNTVQGAFTDTAKMKPGWILGSNGQLLFWVPPWSQVGLWRPSNTAIIGVEPTKLDFSQFRHGPTWSEVKSDITC